MSRNTSIFLVVGFLAGGMIFGFVFWHAQSGAGDELSESLEKTRVASTTPEKVAGVNAQVNQSSGATAPGAQNLTQLAAADTPATSEAQTVPNRAEEENPKDEATDWETFKDEENNFEFKHPVDIRVISNGDIITLSKDAVTWKIRIYENKKNLILSSWYTDYFSEKERKNCVLSDSSVKVGSYETKYANPNSDPTKCERDGYFATSSDKKTVLKISLDKETVENANKILATFKFGA
jgi:hypothetical protein